MKDEPDIIKELREEEKNGKLKTNNNSEYETTKINENGTIQIIKKDLENKSYDDKEIKDLEEKFFTIFNNYTVAITLADKNEKIISWNKYTEEILNMTKEDLFKLPLEKLYPKEEWKKIRDENIKQKGMRYKLDTKMKRKDGNLFDVEISISVLRGREGTISGSVAIFRDISKLKKTERKLIDSENKYKTIFENSAVAITLTDENENIISWNKYAEDLIGMGEKDLYLMPVEKLYPEEEWKEIRNKDIRKKGMDHHFETKILNNNKEKVDVSISISVLKNYKGDIIGSIGVIRDITEESRIKNELEDKHNLMQSLIDNIPDFIYFKDENNRYIKVNNAKANLSNNKPDELIGKTDYDIFDEKEGRIVNKDDETVIKTGKEIVNKFEKIKDSNGKKYWVSSIKIPRYDSQGKIIGMMGISRNITKLKKSQERYKYFFDAATDPIIILDKEGKFIDVNNQVTKILGYKKDELIGKNFTKTNILTNSSLKIALENFKKRIDGEKVPTYEIEINAKDGEKIPAEINANVLYENGEIIGDYVILRDLRDRYKRVEIEKELNQSKNRFQDIFNKTSDFLIYIEKDKILDINEAALNIGNLKKDEIIGQNISNLKKIFSEEGLEKNIKAINELCNGNKIRDYECDILSSEGNTLKFLFSADCIKQEKNIPGILLRGKNITQRQRAWEELVKLEEKYRVLAETSADGVLTIDPFGRLTYINPSFEKMCSRRKSQILATLFRDYLSEDSVYFFQQVFVDARKNDEKIENVELELVHANGDIIPIELNMAPFKKENKFGGMVCTIRDITERRKVEEELKKSERLKTEFMNIAAHELRSPVTPIKGYLDLIINDKDTSKKVKDWGNISLRNTERLLRLINDILDVSRLDTDTMRFEMEKINPVKILDEIVEDMKAVIEKKNLKFEVKIPRDLPNIMGDRHRLSQVLKNLFVNAIKFTDNGLISIKAEKKKDYILIEVKDSGVGISKDELKKIFNKFYQAYTGDDRKNEGTGLGLFICKEILQKHNGDIWVESELGRGSCFFIKIPYIHKMVIDLKNKKKKK